MARTFQANANNDLFIGTDGNLSIVTGINAVLQGCQEAVETLRGELVFFPTEGVDYENTVWDGGPNIVEFDRQAQAEILKVNGVVRVIDFESSISGDTLTYTAQILTSFGTGTVTNGV